MERLVSFTNRIVNGVMYFLTIVLVFTTGTQIFLRVLFDLPLSWTEEVATYTFIWWVFFGAILALRESRHLGIDAFVKRFPPKWTRYWQMGIYLAIMGYLVVMFIQGVKLVRVQMIHNTPITDIPLGIVTAIIPICAAIMGLYTIYLARRHWRGEKAADSSIH